MLYLDPRASFHSWRLLAKDWVMQRDLEVKWSNRGILRGVRWPVVGWRMS